MSGEVREWLARVGLGRQRVPLFYDESYRLPLTNVESTVGIEPRGVDFTTWYVLEAGVVRPQDVHRPEPISFAELSRVHDAAYLESLGRPEALARIFASDPYDVPVDALLGNLRMVCGGTLGATRLALARKGPAVHMAGGVLHSAAHAHTGAPAPTPAGGVAHPPLPRRRQTCRRSLPPVARPDPPRPRPP